MTDTTELKRLQEQIRALTAENQRLKEQIIPMNSISWQAVLASSPDFILLLDKDAKIEYINQYTLEESPLGLLVYDISRPETHDLIRTTLEKAKSTGEAHAYRSEGIDDRWYETHVKMIMDTDREVYIMSARNITDRVVAEQERNRLQEQIIREQQRALEELSTPIIPLMERIIVLPVIGSIDNNRARDLMRNLLAGISEHRAKTVILDVTGVPMIDSGVADHLNRTIQAARLKGAQTIVTGISDGVAETIVDLGIDWETLETMRDLQSGLVLALQRAGFTLQRT
ncbi:MAG: STAS domain-containing protein [Aggregatilineales bacterium]